MSIWDKYPDFTADELRTLVAVTAQVLLESDAATGAVPQDLLDLPAGATARELAAALGADSAAIRDLLDDDARARQAALSVLGEVRRHPALATRVADAYEARGRTMAVETVLLAGALVILAIKLKEVSFTKEGVRASFTESQEAVKAFIRGLLPGGGGSRG
jgi:hypothetical protein